jgi:GNAT superfamily N-acetyltransferase/membrane protease YdiL (CAAX protease family)
MEGEKESSMKPQESEHSWGFDGLLAGLGIIGALAFFLFYEQVSPYAAIDFRLTRPQAQARAERFLRGQGFSLEGYQRALRFQERTLASYYLQRTLGVAGANQVMRTDCPIWLWQARWFRPLQKEEFLVSVSPAGRIVGFFHLLPEEAPGADLTPEAARQIALDFLRRQGVPLEKYQSQAAESEKRPHRTDHVFTWEHRTLRWGEGRLRLTVGVYGDRVGAYNHWLKVPEAFERRFGQERAAAETLSWFSWLAYGLLLLCAFGAAAWAYRYRTLNRTILGIAGMVVLLSVGSALNALPLARMSYPTEEDYRSYVVRSVAEALFEGGQILLIVVIAGLAGDALARLVWPRQRKLLAQKVRQGGLIAAGWRGLALAGFGLGFITLFKLIVQRLGGWYPLYAEYSNLYSTAFPWIEPLLVGLRAASSEELTFRLFAIALLLRLTRRRWVALLVPAAIWAFLHSTYINSPVYLRGIELTLVGLVYGYLFLRFDVATPLVAHYTYNAVIVGQPLLRSSEPYFFLSGLAVVLLPTLPLLLALLGRRWARPHPSDVRIRPVTLEEVPSLALLGREGPHPPFEALEAGLSDPSRVGVWAEVDGQPVGFAAATLGPLARVETVFVAPAYRRQGLGTRLWEALRAALEERGATSWEVRLSPRDSVARAFWLAQGLEPWEEVFRGSA